LGEQVVHCDGTRGGNRVVVEMSECEVHGGCVPVIDCSQHRIFNGSCDRVVVVGYVCFGVLYVSNGVVFTVSSHPSYIRVL